MNFECIFACDSQFGIGKNGDLPWRGTPIANADLKWFSQLTTLAHTAVIMGRKTMESIPAKSWPLPGRINIVLSRANEGITLEGVLTKSPVVHMSSLNAALAWCRDNYTFRINNVFVIGGASLYNEAFAHPLCKRVYMTEIFGNYDCDTHICGDILLKYFEDKRKLLLNFGSYHFPTAITVFEPIANIEDGNVWCSGAQRETNPSTTKSEWRYLDLMESLVYEPPRGNRTGILTSGKFGQVLKFNLSDKHGLIMPLLTTKFVAFKAIAVELLWFLRGSTDTEFLKKHGVTIWNDNTTRGFLDKRGLTDYAEGETGPIYGSQWRNWNGEGIDQLADIIARIKKDPTDRRLLVSAWNPSKINKMTLPPCHYCFQFYVGFDGDKPVTLSCLVNMRSADMALGVPFNIASYALLTHMVAQITGLRSHKLTLVMGDCHVYANQLAAIEEQLRRRPVAPPTFRFSQKILHKPNLSIDDFAWCADPSDFIVENYYPYPPIKMEMAV